MKAKKESGQAIVEFAIVLPILLIILCAIFDFGWFFMNQYETNHAAYEGARYVATHLNADGIDEAALKEKTTALIKANMKYNRDNITVDYSDLYDDEFPTVTVTNPVKMLTFVGGAIFGETYDIEVECTFSGAES